MHDFLQIRSIHRGRGHEDDDVAEGADDHAAGTGAVADLGANPALGASPLALLGGAPPLWSVVAADPAAFAAGIQLGMTKAQVAQFINVQISFRSEAQEKSAHTDSDERRRRRISIGNIESQFCR